MQFCSFTSLSPDERWQKRNKKCFLVNANCKNLKICVKTSCFSMFCLVRTVQTPMCLVGLFLELEIIKNEENIGTIDTFQAPRQKHIAKKCCVRIRKKNQWRCFDHFHLLLQQKNAKYLCVCACAYIFFSTAQKFP